MKLKKKLFFSLLSVGAIGFVTTAGVVLSSCSSTSNPYAKYSNITSNINGTQYQFKYNTNSTFGIQENDKFTTVQELYNKIFEIKDDKNEPLKLQPGMSGKYPQQQWNDYNNAIKKYNDAYITSQVFSYLSSFMSYFTQILIRSQSYINPLNVKQFADITQWNEKQNGIQGKEFIFATKFGTGEGYNTYSIWPKEINLDFDLSSNYKEAGTAAYGEKDDPTNASIKVNIKKFDVTYSWYKHEQVGGEYIDKIDTINNSLTTTQKQILKNNFGLDKISTLNYTISLDTLASAINFNYNPSVYKYIDPKDPKIETRIYTGQGLIAPGWIEKGENQNKTWVVDIENQSPYNILGNNAFQTLKIIKDATNFFKGGLVNNRNYLPYRAFELIWKIGFFANNQNAKDIDTKLFHDEVSSKQSWFLNESNYFLNSSTTPEWEKIKKNVNYAKGIEEIYKLFKIMN